MIRSDNMEINNEYINNLIKKYRTELYETDGIDLREIDSLIPDDDLKLIIRLNNSDMCDLINERPLKKDLIRRLLIANINFYKLAKKRKISIPGTSFLMSIASSVDYKVDKLYSELNVGAYYRPHRPR